MRQYIFLAKAPIKKMWMRGRYTAEQGRCDASDRACYQHLLSHFSTNVFCAVDRSGELRTVPRRSLSVVRSTYLLERVSRVDRVFTRYLQSQEHRETLCARTFEKAALSSCIESCRSMWSLKC